MAPFAENREDGASKTWALETSASVTTGGALPTLTRAAALPITPAASRASTRNTQSPEIAVPSVSNPHEGAGDVRPGIEGHPPCGVEGAPFRRLDAPAELDALDGRGRGEGNRAIELGDRPADERLTRAAMVDRHVGADGHERLSGARRDVHRDARGLAPDGHLVGHDERHLVAAGAREPDLWPRDGPGDRRADRRAPPPPSPSTRTRPPRPRARPDRSCGTHRAR